MMKKGDKYMTVSNKEFTVKNFWANGQSFETLVEAENEITKDRIILVENNEKGGYSMLTDVTFL